MRLAIINVNASFQFNTSSQGVCKISLSDAKISLPSAEPLHLEVKCALGAAMGCGSRIKKIF